jgi:hypothetical protein
MLRFLSDMPLQSENRTPQDHALQNHSVLNDFVTHDSEISSELPSLTHSLLQFRQSSLMASIILSPFSGSAQSTVG